MLTLGHADADVPLCLHPPFRRRPILPPGEREDTGVRTPHACRAVDARPGDARWRAMAEGDQGGRHVRVCASQPMVS